MLAEQRLEAEINIAEIFKNGWAGSRLKFKNGTETNPQGFGEYAAKALKYATSDTANLKMDYQRNGRRGLCTDGCVRRKTVGSLQKEWQKNGDLGKNNSKKLGKPPGNQFEQTT